MRAKLLTESRPILDAPAPAEAPAAEITRARPVGGAGDQYSRVQGERRPNEEIRWIGVGLEILSSKPVIVPGLFEGMTHPAWFGRSKSLRAPGEISVEILSRELERVLDGRETRIALTAAVRLTMEPSKKGEEPKVWTRKIRLLCPQEGGEWVQDHGAAPRSDFSVTLQMDGNGAPANATVTVIERDRATLAKTLEATFVGSVD